MKKEKYEVVQKKNSSVRNVIGSSCDNNTSWIKNWKEYTNKEPGRCIYLGCSNQATLGGHLEIKFNESQEFCFIAPICAKCNSSTIKVKFHRAKKNTIFLKIPKNPCIDKMKEKILSQSNKNNSHSTNFDEDESDCEYVVQDTTRRKADNSNTNRVKQNTEIYCREYVDSKSDSCTIL
jgi:hypothetical protein